MVRFLSCCSVWNGAWASVIWHLKIHFITKINIVNHHRWSFCRFMLSLGITRGPSQWQPTCMYDDDDQHRQSWFMIYIMIFDLLWLPSRLLTYMINIIDYYCDFQPIWPSGRQLCVKKRHSVMPSLWQKMELELDYFHYHVFGDWHDYDVYHYYNGKSWL